MAGGQRRLARKREVGVSEELDNQLLGMGGVLSMNAPLSLCCFTIVAFGCAFVVVPSLFVVGIVLFCDASPWSCRG